MPDRQGQFPSWLEHSQYLADRVKGEGKNITPNRLITASNLSAGNRSWSAEATSNCTFLS